MKIAISSPVDLRALAALLASEPGSMPRGMGSTAVTPIVAGLIARGHDVTVFTLSPDVAGEVIVRGPRLSAFVGPCRSSGRARDLWRAEVSYLASAIAREAPAFVHAHWTYEFALGALVSGVPTLTTIHDLPWNVLRYFRDPYRAARVLLAYKVAARGRRYTAVSTDAANHFRRYFRSDAEITVVPNFLSDAIFAMGDQRPREQPASAPVFYTALQGWTTRKNGEAALRALAQVRRELPAASLLMVGHDYERDGRAYCWAVKHRLTEGVDWRGPLPYQAMLATLYREADILVHPSLDESFSMAALEAIALGKPVIGGAGTPGIREVLDYGSSGLLVDVKDADAVAAAMLRLARDQGLREAIISAAHASAFRRFREEAVLMAYESIYSLMLAKHAPQAKAASTGCLHDSRAGCETSPVKL